MATPDGWKTARLEQVSEFIGRGQAPSYVDRADGVFAISQKCVRAGKVTPDAARPHDAAKPVKDAAVLRAGDVCVNSTGTGTAGRVGLWSGANLARYFVDTHVTIVRGRRDHVQPKFLTEWLLSVEAQKRMTDECFSGSTNQIELNRSAFAALEIPLPPLAEQRKIAAILSSIDETIEKTEAVIAQLQLVKKAMMQELLTRGMPGRHTRFKRTEIGEIPEGWEVAPLDELLDEIEAGWSPQCEARPAADDEWGVLKVSAVSGGEYRECENKALPVGLAPRASAQVARGDVLLARASGVLELVGRTVYVFEARPRLMLSDKIMRLRPSAELNGLFLHYSMQSDSARRQIMEVCGGSHMRNLSQGSLRKVRLAVPDVPEQDRISTAIRAVEAMVEAETSAVRRLYEAKSTLGVALLSGERRVTPDETSP